jgi:hypothetical protein
MLMASKRPKSKKSAKPAAKKKARRSAPAARSSTAEATTNRPVDLLAATLARRRDAGLI